MFRRPLFVLLLLAAGGVSAQAYKWVDAHGTVHYSEAAPPPGTKYSRITLSGSVEPVAPSVADSASPATDAAQPQAADANKPMRDTPENRAKLCASLKTNLDALRGSGPVVMEVNGQSTALDAAQRKQQLDTAQAQYAQYCQGQ
ncbi:MAG TPA: DUF4124 domain-containing protein [Dyella sp.]|nr:DUF4124 domain-containing protein [Dyella sp.]